MRSGAAQGIDTKEDVARKLVPTIVGSDYLAYSYAREFASRYGVRTKIIAMNDLKYLSSSKYVDYEVMPDADDEKAVVERLSRLGEELKGSGRVGILFGAGDGDLYARIFSKNKAVLEEWFVVPYIDFDLLDRLTQKEFFYDLCARRGVAYPETTLVDAETGEGLADALEMRFPLIAKPSNSAAYHYARFEGKKKIFEVEDADELKGIYQGLHGSGYADKLICQDLIPGGDDAIHTLTSFSGGEGCEIQLMCHGRVILQDHSPSAIGNPACIELNPAGDDEGYARMCREAASILEGQGYVGYANFDVKFDSRDGKYKFFEVNTRAGRNTYYVSIAGTSFVEPIVNEFVLGRLPETRAGRGCGFDSLPYDTSSHALFSIVPAAVIERHVSDPSLRDSVLAMYRAGKAFSPLFGAHDTPMHSLWSRANEHGQVKKFDRWMS